jgi:hypothetical protein
MYVLNKKEKQLFILIGSFYGVKTVITKEDANFWDGDKIRISDSAKNFAKIASAFFHELGHFKNWKENRYPIYHDPKKFKNFRKHFKTYKLMVRYALDAEIETERQGLRLMRDWMPEVDYFTFYKDTKVCYYFLYGYYLGA